MGSMARTNIDIDEEQVQRVMTRWGLRTKREAVEFALKLAAPAYDPAKIAELKGWGWEGDLAEIRGGPLDWDDDESSPPAQ